MPKKTLNEATVRQFMKLVNHKASAIDSFITENYNEEEKMEEGAYAEGEGHKEEKMEEGVYEEEAVEEMAPAMEAEAEDEDADPVADMPPMDMDDDPAGKAGEVDITPEMAEVLIDLGDMLKGAMGSELEDDDMGDEPADLPEPPPAGDEPPADDEPAMMEAKDANEEMNEEEMIQEVARRVAARILKAKNAKKDLDEALGNK